MPISLYRKVLRRFGWDPKTKYIKAQHKKMHEKSFLETLKTREGKLIIFEFYKSRSVYGRHTDVRELWHNYDFCCTLMDNLYLLKCIDIKRSLFNSSREMNRDPKRSVTFDCAMNYYLRDSSGEQLKVYLYDWSVLLIKQMEYTELFKEFREDMEKSDGKIFILLHKCYSVMINL